MEYGVECSLQIEIANQALEPGAIADVEGALFAFDDAGSGEVVEHPPYRFPRGAWSDRRSRLERAADGQPARQTHQFLADTLNRAHRAYVHNAIVGDFDDVTKAVNQLGCDGGCRVDGISECLGRHGSNGAPAQRNDRGRARALIQGRNFAKKCPRAERRVGDFAPRRRVVGDAYIATEDEDNFGALVTFFDDDLVGTIGLPTTMLFERRPFCRIERLEKVDCV